MKVYFGFAISDSMFNGDCIIHRRAVSLDEARGLIAKGIVSCINPSHRATVEAVRHRLGIELPIPETPPKIALESGEAFLLMNMRSLPRLVGRHEYMPEEISVTEFSFALYTVE